MQPDGSPNRFPWRQLFLLYVLSFFALTVFLNFYIHGEDQFPQLAQSLMQGKLHFLEKPGRGIDAILFNGQYYWPLGIFPALVLLPFVWIFNFFGAAFHQGYLQPIFVAGVFYFCFRTARFYNYARDDALVLAFGFTFSSVFLNVLLIPWSWWFAQVIVVFLLFAFIHEYLGRKRYWLLGLLAGCALLTRTSLLPLSVFVLADVCWLSEGTAGEKIKKIASYGLPLAGSLAVLFFYNYLRFGNGLEQGYSYQILLNQQLYRAREYGLMSTKHLAGNLYYLFLSLPLPVFRDGVSHVLAPPYLKANSWGMSIFITSPYFLYLFILKHRDRLSLALWLTVVSICVPLLFYYGIGFRQFGYRYALDFLPFLFWLLMKNYRAEHEQLSAPLKALLILPSATNLYFMVTLLFLP